MNELVNWLRAQLDEDERVARAAQGHGVDALVSDEAYAHLTRWRAARVLREVAAKRAIMDWYVETEQRADAAVTDGLSSEPDDEAAERLALERSLRHLASAYEDRPDYREEWKP